MNMKCLPIYLFLGSLSFALFSSFSCCYKMFVSLPCHFFSPCSFKWVVYSRSMYSNAMREDLHNSLPTLPAICLSFLLCLRLGIILSIFKETEGLRSRGRAQLVLCSGSVGGPRLCFLFRDLVKCPHSRVYYT